MTEDEISQIVLLLQTGNLMAADIAEQTGIELEEVERIQKEYKNKGNQFLQAKIAVINVFQNNSYDQGN